MVSNAATINQTRHDEPAEQPRWLSQEWLEPRFVIITGLALVGSFIGHQIGAPVWTDTVFALIAFGAGGIFGARTALESLFIERKLDVDMLMVLAALGAASIGAWHEGAILLFLFSLSNVLQDYAIGRSRNAIRSLFMLYPEEAKVKRGETIMMVKSSDIQPGDIVLIEPGERIPVDGEIMGGRSSVDQSPITGESMPVEKGLGDSVFAGTLNKQGVLDVRATQAAANTTLSRIIQLVEEAQDAKAPTERFLDKFEQFYAALIIGGVLLFIVVPPLFFGVDFNSNFYRAMVLMTVASPCALVISVPAALISAIAAAARGGVLFKGGAYLEQLATVQAIAFDKTGTLTEGKPEVTDVVPVGGDCEVGLLSLAASVESRSEHPLAQAIVDTAQRQGIPIEEPEDFEAIAGKGIVAQVDGRRVRVGRIAYLSEYSVMPAHLARQFERLEQDGKTVIGLVREGEWLGLIALADQLRLEAAEVVQVLQHKGIQVTMLTGDNERVAQAIAAQVGISDYRAGLLPEDKVAAIQSLQVEHGTVAHVGDGVNDAPALATADIGIAMGAAGTDVALETADLVLMGDKLELIEEAINLSRKAHRVVWQNITFSIGVIILLIAGAFLVDLPLPLGVLGHEGSTVIVVLNGLITLLLLPEIQRRREASAS